MITVALISTFNDGRLLDNCVNSAHLGCDSVIVEEGAVGEGERWESDAAKRTYMLHKAKGMYKNAKDLWVLWLDGDEVLIWPEMLRDWIERATKETAAGGFPLRLVELDGSVAYCHGKVINAKAVRKYLHSSYQIETPTGMVVALPNVKICSAGGVPYGSLPTNEDGSMMRPGSEEMEMFLARHRPPLAGEPHLLHRSMLRDPERNVRRLSDVEGDWFDEKIREAGLENVS